MLPWFRVDDAFHSHPKVLACSPAAIGLWTLAGSWCAAHLTDGYISDRELRHLLPRGSAQLASILVSNGLWTRMASGYQFHDWDAKNLTRERWERERENSRDRQRRWAAAHSNAVSDADPNGVSDTVSNAVTNSAPTRPDLSKGVGSTQGDRPRARARDRNPAYSGEPNPAEGAAGRHPSARTLAEAEAAAGLNGAPPARGDTVADIARSARGAITRPEVTR